VSRKIGLTARSVQAQSRGESARLRHPLRRHHPGDAEPIALARAPVQVQVEVALVLEHDLSMDNPAIADVIGAAYALPAIGVVAAGSPNGTSRSSTHHLSETQAKARFEAVRKRGFSYVDGKILAGIRAIGPPVFNAAGDLTAVLTVLGVGKNFSAGGSSLLAGTLADIARSLSQRLGSSFG
jgi:DNA-binding IclR family transcriptional regulator